MSSLGIVSNTDQVALAINNAPALMMVRELMQNAIEASVQAPKPQIKVDAANPSVFGYSAENGFGYSDEKLCFWNNGPGMSAEEMRKCTNIGYSGSGKPQGQHANFGRGVKATTLPVNQKGVIWISCKYNPAEGKNTVVSTMLYYDAMLGYCRYDFWDLAVDSNTGYTDIVDITAQSDAPWNTQPNSYWALSQEWTAIILCGNDEQQNTTTDPGINHTGKYWLADYLFQRYMSIDDGVDIKLIVAHKKVPGQSVHGSTFKTFSKCMELSAANPSHDVQEETVYLGNGINIRYLYDGLIGNKNKTQWLSSYSSSQLTSKAGGSFCSLVYKNENYDVLTEDAMRKAAGVLGIHHGWKSLRVFVYITTDEMGESSIGAPEIDRQYIQRFDSAKTAVKLLDYTAEIRDSMPQWFKNRIAAATPPQINTTDITQKANTFLQMLTNLRLTANAGNTGNIPGRRNNTPPITTRGTNKKLGNITQRTLHGGLGSTHSVVLTIPPIMFIEDASMLAASTATNLDGKAAEYVQNCNVFINCMYTVLSTVVDKLVESYAYLEQTDLTLFLNLRDAAMEMSRNEMAWLVTSGLAFALAKRADVTFSQDEEDAMVSAAVLTTHADRLMTDEIISKLTSALKTAKTALETAVV